LKVLFEDIEQKKKIPLKFPDENPIISTNRDSLVGTVESTKIWKPEIFLPLLRDILPSDSHAMLSLDDAMGLADELSSSANREVTFKDFVQTFNSS
jgi:hypothetical protein